MSKDSFIERLTAEPKCALSIVDFDLEQGILLHVGIPGLASVMDVDHDRLVRFVGKYLGSDSEAWNKWFVQNVVDPIDKMVEVRALTTVTKNVSYFRMTESTAAYNEQLGLDAKQEIQIRAYHPDDAKALANIYYNTINTKNLPGYPG